MSNPLPAKRVGGGFDAARVSLYFMYYNFGRVHQTLRVTPAMAAKVTDRLFDVSDIVALLESAESKKAA